MEELPGDEEQPVPPEGENEIQELEEEDNLIDIEIIPQEENQGSPQASPQVSAQGSPSSTLDDASMNRLFQNALDAGKATPKRPQTLRELMVQEDERNLKPDAVFDRESNAWYHPQESIGTAGAGAIKVYRATNMLLDSGELERMTVENLFVSVMFIRADEESGVLDNLKQRVEKNGLVPDHPNIMGIKRPFTSQGNYYVVFPFMDFGSLRYIVFSRYPNGMPEDFIIVALREALKGLSFIHGNGQVHKEITAGHIFFSTAPEFRLAFSASIFDHRLHQNQPSSSSCLPMETILNWAAAPEVYESESTTDQHTEKSDIWLIGIIFLELAYGKLRFRDRNDLMSFIGKITAAKKLLPMREEEESGGTSPMGKSRFLKGLLVPSCMKIGRAFSKKFERMVLSCLAMDPAKRPTADELLRSRVIRSEQKNVFHFEKLLR